MGLRKYFLLKTSIFYATRGIILLERPKTAGKTTKKDKRSKDPTPEGPALV